MSSNPGEKTIIVKEGRSRLSEILNSEFAKAAGASFGAAGAELLAERIKGGQSPTCDACGAYR
jgi:hypothetical protein